MRPIIVDIATVIGILVMAGTVLTFGFFAFAAAAQGVRQARSNRRDDVRRPVLRSVPDPDRAKSCRPRPPGRPQEHSAFPRGGAA